MALKASRDFFKDLIGFLKDCKDFLEGLNGFP